MGSTSPPSFTFVDLFAGIGGFHAALGALGGQCVYAVEKDPAAATIYERNWRTPALGDICVDTEDQMVVPEHDVLAAGFPCQPFSKSGHQRGMDEARGTLFWNICEILRVRRPSLVLLENVRNIAGPRHAHEWEVIVRSLRELGYRVSASPLVMSPHRLPPEMGGRPQIRDRVFIVGTYVGKRAATSASEIEVTMSTAVPGWRPTDWALEKHLPLESSITKEARLELRLSGTENEWVDAWDDFVRTLRSEGVKRLPGFPIWKDAFVRSEDLAIDPETPHWKANFLRKNADLYSQHEVAIEGWLARWNYLEHFPVSRRKFEWQAQDAADLSEVVLHFRPSGLRVKKATYVPALVAITQTSVLGSQRRRLSVREAARLQGLPEWFDFTDQSTSASYKQLGNGVNVGVAYYVARSHVMHAMPRFEQRSPGLASAVMQSPLSPDVKVERYWDLRRPVLHRTSAGTAIADDDISAAG